MRWAARSVPFFFVPAKNLLTRVVPNAVLPSRRGRNPWTAEALELPGAMCYGQTTDEAMSNVERLAIEGIADRIVHGELPSSAFAVAFTMPDEHLAPQ